MIDLHHSLRAKFSPLPQGEGRIARMICAFCNFICTAFFLAAALLSKDVSEMLPALGGAVLSLLPAAVQFLGALVPYGIWSLYEVFLLGAMFFGERMDFYTKFSWWDVVLHAISGFCFAAIGLSLYPLLFGTKQRGRKQFWGAVTFMICFACTVGVLWEFVEFAADRLLYTDMQRDTILSAIAARGIEHGKKIDEIHMQINENAFDGYLDIGLHDTMTDQIAAMAGSIVFAVIYARYDRRLSHRNTDAPVANDQSFYHPHHQNHGQAQKKEKRNGVVELFVIRS